MSLAETNPMDKRFRELQRQYQAQPSRDLSDQLRHIYYRTRSNDILWAQKPRGHLYHAWERQ